jgi:hypothetical protein
VATGYHADLERGAARVLRVYCDFNDGTEDDRYWILWFEGKPLEEQVERLGLKAGDRVLLYQDEDDCEVEGTLLFLQTHRYFLGEKLCVRVDWSTLRRLNAVIQLSRLREIGLALWDPIGVEPVADSGCENEYDRYLWQVVRKLYANEPASEAVNYLVKIETEDMSLRLGPTTVSRAVATVEAINTYLEALRTAPKASVQKS